MIPAYGHVLLPAYGHVIETLSVALIFAATSGAFAFVVIFGIFVPWWRTAEGRNLMVLVGGLSALGLLSLFRRVIDEGLIYEGFILVTYSILAWQMWRLVWLMVKAQISKGRG